MVGNYVITIAIDKGAPGVSMELVEKLFDEFLAAASARTDPGYVTGSVITEEFPDGEEER